MRDPSLWLGGFHIHIYTCMPFVTWMRAHEGDTPSLLRVCTLECIALLYVYVCRYSAGIIPTRKSLSLCEKVSVSAFCRSVSLCVNVCVSEHVLCVCVCVCIPLNVCLHCNSMYVCMRVSVYFNTQRIPSFPVMACLPLPITLMNVRPCLNSILHELTMHSDLLTRLACTVCEGQTFNVIVAVVMKILYCNSHSNRSCLCENWWSHWCLLSHQDSNVGSTHVSMVISCRASLPFVGICKLFEWCILGRHIWQQKCQ